MFKVQARRLLRTLWQTPQKLAEELFAILSSDGPLEHKGTLNLRPDPNGDQPVIRVILPDDDTGGNTVEVVRENPDGTFTPVSNIPLTGPAGGSPVPDPTASGNTGTVGAAPSAMPVTTLGKIVSGADQDYVVGVWLNEPLHDASAAYYVTIPAYAPNLSTGDALDPGTIVYVTLYYDPDVAGKVVGVFAPSVWT